MKVGALGYHIQSVALLTVHLTLSHSPFHLLHMFSFFFLGIIWTAMALELMSPCSYRAPNVLSFGALKTKCKFKYNGCMCINNIKVAHSLFISEKLPGKM